MREKLLWLQASRSLEGVDMRVRTFTVDTPRQACVNAALLCSFAVPDADMNYLAYSFNECVSDEEVLVYVAPLYCERGHYSLGVAAADHSWQQAFWQMTGQAPGGMSPGPFSAWHHIDVGQQALSVVSCEQHATLSISKAQVLALLACPLTGPMGQAVECSSLSGPPACASSAGHESRVSTPHLDAFERHLLEREQALNNKALQLVNRQDELLHKQQRIEGQCSDLQIRLQGLDEREALLQRRTQALVSGYRKLAANRDRFSGLLRQFQSSMQSREVVRSHITHAPLSRAGV